jgi:flagellar M-ring protein FliF
VSSAVGVNPERGDVVTIKSMQFEAPTAQGTLVTPGLLDRLDLDVMSLVQALVLALVLLILGLFVLRPILARPEEPTQPRLDAPAEAGGITTPDASGEAAPLTGEIDEREFDASGLSLVSQDDRPGHRQNEVADQSEQDPVVRLRNLIGQRQEESVEILRSWLEGEEEKV